MEILQILTVNWSNIFNFVMLLIAAGSFVIARNRYIKQTVNQADLDKLEKKMNDGDDKLSKRIDKVEDQLRDDIADIKQMQRDIYNHILNCPKR